MADLHPPADRVPDERDALRALLEWYDAVGVDIALEEAPIDRFAEAERAKARRPAAPPTDRPPPFAPVPASPAAGESRPTTVVPGTDAVMAARAAAASAQSLDALRELLAGFDGCNLKLTARNLVFSDGNPEARIMLVGEAPGSEEDRTGKPFVGRSGKLLDLMLAAIGLTRNDVYIANVIYWRPPGNREPSDQEVAICKPFITRQIELADPDILVMLGNQSSKALLGRPAQVGIRKLRGRWLEYDTGRRKVPVLPTFHPSYLLRTPIEKRNAWKDMLALRARFRGAAQPID